MKKVFSVIVLMFLWVNMVQAQEFLKKEFLKNGKTLPYRVMYPKNYDAEKKYPLVIFLHGAGERGSDNEKQLTHGKEWLINNFYTKHQAIVIAPQCPKEDYWAHAKREVLPKGSPMFLSFIFYENPPKNKSMILLEGLIKNLRKSGKIDKSRIYVGGLSMGGLGTYELLARHPKMFAAAYVICGAADMDWVAKRNKKTPIWIFHGTADAVVSISYARTAKDRLNKNGRPFKYNEFEGVNHNSWDNVFNETGTEVSEWLFTFKK